MKHSAVVPRLPSLGQVYLAAGLLLSALGAGCGAGPAVEVEPPSVLVVTLSSVRPDHLAAYGDAEAFAPNFDRLAKESTVFRRAYAASPLSVPSNATLLTGLNPPSHGVRDNGSAMLPDDVQTLADRFLAAGYSTGAFTAGLGAEARWNFGRGFKVYHDRTGEMPGPLNLGEDLPADAVVGDAIGALSRASGPLFAWVNLADAALPITSGDLDENTGYDGEITAVDAALGRLVTWWDRARPNAVLVVTADHGEPLGEGGEAVAGALLTDGALRVPLLLRATGTVADRVRAGAIAEDPVGLVDVAPTLLALANLGGEPEDLDGADLRKGGSKIVYHEALAGWAGLGLAPLYGYTVADGRYTEGTWGGWYPMEGERVRLQGSPISDEDRARRLARLRSAHRARVAPDPGLSGAEIAVLAAHGFLSGDLLNPPGPLDPRDADALPPLISDVSAATAAGRYWVAARDLAILEDRSPDSWDAVLLRALLYRAQGRLAEAVPLFAALYQRNPAATIALQQAEVLSAVGRMDEAARWYDAVLVERPDNAEARAGCVHLALQRGDLDGALVLLASAPKDDPALIVAEAELLLAQGRAPEALVRAREAWALRPRSARAQATVGLALWDLGEADEAVLTLKGAVGADRFNLPLRGELARRLLELGQASEAARMMAPALLQAPDAAGLQDLYDAARRAAHPLRDGSAG